MTLYLRPDELAALDPSLMVATTEYGIVRRHPVSGIEITIEVAAEYRVGGAA